MENSEFYTRMDTQKRQHPFALGLVPIKNDLSATEYFYREVLVRKEPIVQIKEEPQDIDILTDDLETMETGEDILNENPASDFVASIRSVIPTPIETQDEDQPSIIDQIVKECEKRESVMHIHLKVMVSSIINQRLVDLNSLHIVGGRSLFHNQTLKNAERLKDSLELFTGNYGIEDAHAFLLQNLLDEYLASYLNLLHYLKAWRSNLATQLLDNPVDSKIQAANEIIQEFANIKVLDPNLCSEQDIVPLSNVSLILVYPQISTMSQTSVKHAHENMFRTLLPNAVRCVEKVELKFNDGEFDPKNLTQMCLTLIRETVQGMSKRRPNDHIFLAGWGISALLNMQAIQDVEGVTGVLNFAFPLRSHLGFRGTIDDTICISYCPSLFIVGDAASNMSLPELEEMRENMICESGVVLIGGANNDLRVSPLLLGIERVSQYCVDKIVLEHVVEFMKMVISEGGMSATERREYLTPVEFPDVFDIESTILKKRACGLIGQPKKEKTPKASKE